jgi:hypothetical protein
MPFVVQVFAHRGPEHRPPLPSRDDPWHSFLLEAESTPGPYCVRKEQVTEKSQRPNR